MPPHSCPNISSSSSMQKRPREEEEEEVEEVAAEEGEQWAARSQRTADEPGAREARSAVRPINLVTS